MSNFSAKAGVVVTATLMCFCATPAGAIDGNDRVIELLQSLSNAHGPSGFEEPVRKIMVERMKPLADRVSFDGLGSVIATQGRSGPRVMIDAHMDELGGLIRRVTPDGFLTMQMLGGWLDQALVDQKWVILGNKGPIQAVTGIRDVHLLPQGSDERTKAFPRDTVFLDVGARNAAEIAAMGIAPGDPVAPDVTFAVLNGTRNYVGKAWDDRVGLAVMIEVMRRLASGKHGNQLFYAATVQEEIGLRGAHTAADLIKPDIGIAIEGGTSRDVPGVHPEETQAALGGGPGVFLYDGSALPNRKLLTLIREVAMQKGIPLQFDLVQNYGDDSAEIQRSNGGVPTVNLVVPVRYTHAHYGVMDRGDFDQMVELVVGLAQALDADTVSKVRDFDPAH